MKGRAVAVMVACGALWLLPGAGNAEDAAYRRPVTNSAAAVADSVAMVDIAGGNFLMGSNEHGFQNGYPQHAVRVAQFRMARYDVTFDQWDVYARAAGQPLPPDEGWGRLDRPVINVEYAEVIAFIDWLNANSHRHFRLPSEAQWEYAARAGTSTAYWWGDEPSSQFANTAANSGPDVWEFTSPVGSFPKNPFGLFDMLGNVWQYVADCRHLTYEGAPADGQAWLHGTCDSRVVRGGYYGSLRIGMRSVTRAAAGAHFHSMGLGFRLAEDSFAGQPGGSHAGR